MVFTRRHRRLGSGDSSTSSTGNAPHVVKTYGRVRHRTVNRDSNSAHKFALAASTRPTVAGVVDDSPSSDSDSEKEEPTPKPTAQSGHLPKARPTKTRGSPQTSPADNGDTARPRQSKAVSGNETTDPAATTTAKSPQKAKRKLRKGAAAVGSKAQKLQPLALEVSVDEPAMHVVQPETAASLEESLVTGQGYSRPIKAASQLTGHGMLRRSPRIQNPWTPEVVIDRISKESSRHPAGPDILRTEQTTPTRPDHRPSITHMPATNGLEPPHKPAESQLSLLTATESPGISGNITRRRSGRPRKQLEPKRQISLAPISPEKKARLGPLSANIDRHLTTRGDGPPGFPSHAALAALSSRVSIRSRGSRRSKANAFVIRDKEPTPETDGSSSSRPRTGLTDNGAGPSSVELDAGQNPVEDEEPTDQLAATRAMRFRPPRNARAQTYEIEDDDADGIEDAESGDDGDGRRNFNRRRTQMHGFDRRRTQMHGFDRRQTQIHRVQKTAREQELENPEIVPVTPPSKAPLSLLQTSSDPAVTPPPKRGHRRASITPGVPHSPARIATPHRVVFSPPRRKVEAANPNPSRKAGVGKAEVSGEHSISRNALNADNSDEPEFEETRVPFLPARRYVKKTHLLEACGQKAPIDWVSGGLQACGVLLPETDPTVSSEEQMGEIESEAGLCKIGEATYSEVFSAQWRYVPRTRYDKFNSKKGKVKGERIMQVALKVIPFGNASVKSGAGERQTTLRDLYQEIGATLALSRLSERERCKLQEARVQVKMPLKSKERELGANFVKAFRVCICQGTLPAPLLRAWDRWKAEFPDLCENARPDYYPKDQLFAVFVLEMGGETLENAVVSTWKEARSIIRQLALSMALAERHSKFEHRDLHWGNIMVTRYNSNLTFLYQLPPTGSRSKSTLLSVPSYRLRCTIIDYTLSRLHVENDPADAATTVSTPANYMPENNVFYVDLKDEALFRGEGDIQYEVYRKMRACSNKDWKGFYPRTNVLWLTYVLHKILTTKSPAIMEELVLFVETKLDQAPSKIAPELRKVAGQELLRRWIQDFEQCESCSQVLRCALLDLYK